MSAVKAVILVGGEGTRLRPLTSNVPKPMVPVLNRPFLEHVIRYLQSHGVKDIILALCYLPDYIKEYFGDGREYGVRLNYVVESCPMGTAGAVKNVSEYLNETFIVLNGDVFTDLNITAMLEFHRKMGAKASIALTPVDNPTIYGVVETGEGGRVKRFVEKPALNEVTSNMINAGTYVLEAEVLDNIPSATFSMFEYQLFPLLLQRGEPVYGYPSDAYWIDIGTPEKYRTLNNDLLNGRIAQSAFFLKEKTQVSIAENCTIHKTARITGPVVIGERCHIGADVKITGPSVIGPDCVIKDHSVIDAAIVWSGTFINERAIIGNCVVGKSCRIDEQASVTDGVILGDNVIVVSNCTIDNGIRIMPGSIVDSKGGQA